MILQHLRFIGVVTVCLFAISFGKAQVDSSVCSDESCTCIDDISPAGIMIAHSHSKGEWMMSYRPMQMRMSGQQQEHTPISENEVLTDYVGSGSAMVMNMHMLMLMGGLSDRITVMAMFQFQSANMEMSMKSASRVHHHNMRSSGLGDTKIFVLYAPFKRAGAELIVGLGANLSTGSIVEKGAASAMMYPNLRMPYSMQNGSGSFDLLPSLTYVKQIRSISYSAQVQSTLRCTNNVLGYRLGNSIETNFWLGKKWLPFVSSTLRLNASAVQKIKGIDKQLDSYLEPAANAKNSGAYMIMAAVGSSFNFQKSFLKKHKISIEGAFPLYQYFNGIQMKNSFQAMGAWNYSI